jgi:two-component system OmpR family response regulator
MNASAFFTDSAPPLSDVYELSPLGEMEVRNGRTRASARELDMLVRFDGLLTLDQVWAGMAGTAPELEAVFGSLKRAGWLRRKEDDRFEQELQAQLDQLSGSEQAAVDASERSLRRKGYSVEIAREPTRALRTAPTALQAVIVEDEVVLARFIKTYLQLEGIESRTAGDRAAVLAMLNQPPVPDVILLDVQLPDADGFHILARLRAHKLFAHVPVIMLTGEATRGAVIRGIAGGASGYVTKPFEAEALMRAVRTCLGLTSVTPQALDPWAKPYTNGLNWQL